MKVGPSRILNINTDQVSTAALKYTESGACKGDRDE